MQLDCTSCNTVPPAPAYSRLRATASRFGGTETLEDMEGPGNLIPLTKITREQFEWYHKVSGGHYGMEFNFGGPSGFFAFYGEFKISFAGRVDLANFLVAHSCEHGAGEMRKEIGTLRGKIADSSWSVTLREESRLEGVREDFSLQFFSDGTRDGTVASHLLVSYDDPANFKQSYFEHDFELRSDRSTVKSDLNDPGGYYPVSPDRCPEGAEAVDVSELAQRIRGKRLVAFTGAGISKTSGIPAFEGEGGLQEQFPIDSYRFPGAVADWMIVRPRETAAILGTFYTRFMTAAPTRAHVAFAELEKLGILKQIITGNFDELHERAGSRNVHVNEPKYFKKSDKGWAWIKQGEVALVTGISMDANNGLLDYARDYGLQIVVIGPSRPLFMHAQDWFIEGVADDILPELARILENKRVS